MQIRGIALISFDAGLEFPIYEHRRAHRQLLLPNLPSLLHHERRQGDRCYFKGDANMKGCLQLLAVATGLFVLFIFGVIWLGVTAVHKHGDVQQRGPVVVSKTINVKPDTPLIDDKASIPPPQVAPEDPQEPLLTGLKATDLIGPLKEAGYAVASQVIPLDEAKRMSVFHRYSWTCTDPSFTGELQRRTVFLEGDSSDKIAVIEVSVLHTSLSASKLRSEADQVITMVGKIALGEAGVRQVRESLNRISKKKEAQTESGTETRFKVGNRNVWISATKWGRSMGIYQARTAETVQQEQGASEDRSIRAARLLDLAKPFIQRGELTTAKRRLSEIVDRFPETEASHEATTLLSTLGE